MATEIRYRGETLRFQITLTTGGVAVNLDDYSGIIAVLYYDKNQVIQSYSRDTLAGYDNDNFVVVNASTGRFDILLQPSVSIPANIDLIKMEIQVQKVDTDWEDERWRKIVSDITVVSLKDSRTKSTPVA